MKLFDNFKDLVPAQSCLKCRENGEFLIIMNRRQELFYLNETARFMYKLFNGQRTLQTIFEQIVSVYSVDVIQYLSIQADIIATIRDFQWQEIIELREKEI